jgi:hypothetical protein
MTCRIGPIVRVVMCAANRFDNTVILGARHFYDIMCDQIHKLCDVMQSHPCHCDDAKSTQRACHHFLSTYTL